LKFLKVVVNLSTRKKIGGELSRATHRDTRED